MHRKQIIFQNTAENVPFRFIWPFSSQIQFGLVQNLGLKAAIVRIQKPKGKAGSRTKWQKLVKFYTFS